MFHKKNNYLKEIISTLDLESFRECLRAADPSDFDGHTEFERLTPDERLAWLAQCGRFFSQVKKS